MAPPDLDLKVGTCGWSYPDWVGPFYRRGTSSGQMLERYASVFDTVEVNSTFYATPPRDRVEAWARHTPDGFTFSLKAPEALTHEARLELTPDAWQAIDAYGHAIQPLGLKLDTILLQLPPSLTKAEGLPRLEALLAEEPFPAPLALEARHPSWDDPEVYAMLADHQVTWAWSENQHWTTPAETTTERAYLRFIGDRRIDRFDRLRRDPEPAMRRWLTRLEARHDELTSARVYANNHFAGFGPATVNAFLRLAGQETRRWEGGGGGTLQKGLDEFGL